MKQVNWQRAFAIAIAALIVGVLTTFTFGRAQAFAPNIYAQLFSQDMGAVLIDCPPNDEDYACFTQLGGARLAMQEFSWMLDGYSDILILKPWSQQQDVYFIHLIIGDDLVTIMAWEWEPFETLFLVESQGLDD